jgi:putative transposase
MTGFMFRKRMAFEWKGTPFLIERLLPSDELIVEQADTGATQKVARSQILQAYANGDIVVPEASDQRPARTPFFGRPLQELPKEMQDETTRRWRYVTQVLELGKPVFTTHYLQPILAGIAEKLNDPKPPSLATFYRWYARFRASGETRSLVPRTDLRGRRQSRQDNEVQQIFVEVVEKEFAKSPAMTVTTIYDTLSTSIEIENKRRLPHDQLVTPSMRTVYRMMADLGAYDLAILHDGKPAADRRFRTVGLGPRTQRILERVEVDHTPLDLFLIDERTSLPLGRPMLTMIIDRHSRMPLGYYLSYRGASAAAVMGALRHAVMPKHPATPVVAGIRVEHGWPCYGLPLTLVVDNGLEFHGDDLELVALGLGITIQYCPKRQPRYKGAIERFLKTVNYTFAHQLPGTSLARFHKRGDYDPLKHTVLTLGEFLHVFEKWLLDVYAQRPHRGLARMSPWAKWHEGAAMNEPVLPANLDLLRRQIGLISERSLRPSGITLNKIQYNCDALQPVLNAFGAGTNVRVLHDPNDLGEIYVWGPDSTEPIVVPALDHAYAKGLTALQHDLIMEVQKQNESSPVSARQAQAQISEAITQLVQSKKQSTRRKGAAMRGDDSAKLQQQALPPIAPSPSPTPPPQFEVAAHAANDKDGTSGPHSAASPPEVKVFSLPPPLGSFRLGARPQPRDATS